MTRHLLFVVYTLMLTGAVSTLLSCGNADSPGDDAALQHDHETPAPTAATDPGQISGKDIYPASGAFKAGLANLYDTYASLKDALVATDAEQASLGASSMRQTLDAMDASSLQGEARSFWMERSGAMRGALDQMGHAAGVEDIRKGFADLTKPMQETLTAFGANTRKLFVQHCPMAFDHAGASWISDAEQISNPYFGDKMLRCGNVEATIDLP